MRDLAEAAQLSTTRHRTPHIDDEFLHALLSFVALTARGTAVSFLAECLYRLPAEQRASLPALLLALFQEALYQRHDGPFDHYQPAHVTVPARMPHTRRTCSCSLC
jgi:hypothetical protein